MAVRGGSQGDSQLTSASRPALSLPTLWLRDNGCQRPTLSRKTRGGWGTRRTIVLIQAVQHVRRMRGGAQSHLMRCADGHFYVVKFQNNPQHTRVLVNDWLGTRLAEMIGLPVPVPAIVDVHPWLLENTPDLRMELCGRRTMFTAGLSFGSRYVVSPLEGQVFDYLPETMMPRLRNVRDFAGILALDKWTCNSNGRQAAFWKKSRERKLTATLCCDFGYVLTKPAIRSGPAKLEQ